MRRFLKQIFVFFGIVSSLAFIIQCAASYRIKNREVLHLYDNFHLSYPQRADLLFMGSSRCITHYSPKKFDEFFHCKSLNLGVDGHSELDMHLLKLLSYLKHNLPPKLILLNFDIFINSNGNEVETNKVHKDYFSRYAFRPFSESTEVIDYFGYNLAEKYFPSYALLHYQMLPAIISMKGEYKWRFEGYERHDENWDTLSHPVKLIDSIISFNSEKSINNLKKKMLLFKKVCEDHHISLLLVQSPVYQPVFTNQPIKFPEALARNLGFTFFDFNRNTLNSQIENFYNANHLNTRGVGAFFQTMVNDSNFCAFIRSGLQKKYVN
ncbi:MAG: hypothetical protein NTZ41_00950 [Sphingobacteriales bacterium]|nr:hypothetical protein [Sphingobacteriales bacterium]